MSTASGVRDSDFPWLPWLMKDGIGYKRVWLFDELGSRSWGQNLDFWTLELLDLGVKNIASGARYQP